MVLSVLATWANEGNPKEGKAKQKQYNYTDDCAIAAVVVRPRLARVIAIGTRDVVGSGAQIAPRRVIRRRGGSRGRGRGRRRGGRRPRRFVFRRRHLPPVGVGGRHGLGVHSGGHRWGRGTGHGRCHNRSGFGYGH